MKIEVEIITLYGRPVIYPVCKQAHIFADIAGTRTLTTQAIDKIKQLGYSIVVIQQPVTI